MPSTDRNITLSVDGHFNLKREKWHFRTGIHELMKIALKIDVSAKLYSVPNVKSCIHQW